MVCVASCLPLAAGAPLHGADSAVEIGPAVAHSGAPSWDARGLGPLPWQGIACLDMSDDGRSIAVGTIAPQGDSNLMQLDADGKIVGQHIAGQRWVNEATVSNDGRLIAGLCGTPQGTAGDMPRIFGFEQDKDVHQIGAGVQLDNVRVAGCLWHYGEHSNHLPRVSCRAGDRWVLAGDEEVYWMSPNDSQSIGRARIGPGTTSAMAASPSGIAVVGRYPFGFYYTPGEAGQNSDWASAIVGHGAANPSAAGQSRPAFQNLLVVKSDVRKPVVWSRPVLADVAPSPAPEKGIYGPAVPPHEDLEFEAPLSVAVDRKGEQIAAADYRVWQRVFHPRDGSRDIPFGTRIMPARPTIHIYDIRGNVIRSIAPEKFPEAFWCDFAFSPDGQTLIVSPHNWTSRGLGGQPILPADETARTLYLYDTASGDLRAIHLPDLISSVDCDGSGEIAVGCWNHKVYLLDKSGQPIPSLHEGIDVGAASLVRGSKSGAARFAVATTAGVVWMLDANGKTVWQADLNKLVRAADKPWLKNQQADKVADGIWRANTGHAQSDLGNQIVIQAPHGLILIDPNSGESFEQNWARIVGAGLDPMQIKYVLVTHEHGDHAPGARLWRVITGAQAVGGATTAYDLQHHTPGGTGYGFHPPTPIDIPISQDQELDLAGLKVKAICTPGHTYGSMTYIFQKNGQTYASTGDLIMGGGVLGYGGSLDFSAEDVLRSLRKVGSFRPDMVLGGHGMGPANEFIAQGIEAGEETGWSRMTPPAPNPFCRFTQKNYLIAAWLEPIVAAAYGDIDGDGQADVAVLVPKGTGSVVKIYLNRKGKFAAAPDAEIPLPDLERGSKLRIVHVGKSGAADFFVAGEGLAMLLLAQPERLKYKATPLPMIRAADAIASDFRGDDRRGLLIGARFVETYYTARQRNGLFQVRQTSSPIPRYLNVQLADVDGDKRDDLITSNGDIFLRQPDGLLAERPAFHLHPPTGDAPGWNWVAAGDFEHNGWPDITLLANNPAGAIVWLYRNTRNPQSPFPKEPSAKFFIPGAEVNRDGPTVADWNGDGNADLILTKRGNEGGVYILTGSAADGLSPNRVVSIQLDYVPYYDSRLGVADFTGDGRLGLAGFGRSQTGAMGVYIWLQPAAAPAK